MLTKFAERLFSDEDDQRRAKMLLGTQLMGILLVTAIICYSMIMTPDHPESIWQGSIAVLAFCLSFLFLRLGKLNTASWLIVIVGWGIFTLDLGFVAGISGVSILGQILMLLFTGLTINGVSAIVLTLLTIGVNFIIMQAELSGLIPNLATIPPGEARWFIQTIYAILAAYFIWLSDLVIRKTISRSRETADHYRALFDRTNDGVVIVDLNWNIISANSRAMDMVGYQEVEMIGIHVKELIQPEDAKSLFDIREQMLNGKNHPNFEETLIRKDKSQFPVEFSLTLVHDAKGRPQHIQAIIRDVTERKEYEQQLQHQALHDPLTNLPNRILFENRYQLAHSSEDTNQSLVAVLFVDLDNFKTINDGFGHAVGDQVLMKLGDRMQSSLRESDTVARLGGDEFVIILEDIHNKEDVRKIARKIQQNISQPMMFDGQQIHVTASIGINISEKSKLSETDLLRTSDSAMYQVKEDGKNDFRFYDTAPRKEDLPSTKN